MAKSKKLQDLIGKQVRRSKRTNFKGWEGQVAHGSSVFSGDVEDVSVTGFKIVNLPAGFPGDEYSYKAVLSCRGNYFKLLVKPCWCRKESATDSHCSMGFKILMAPPEWSTFVIEES